MLSGSLQYRWMHARVWLWLILYWLISTIGAGIIARAGADVTAEVAWIVIVMLALVSVCMATERGQWKVWQRIGFVFLAWIVQAILTIFTLFTFGVLMYWGGRSDLVDRVTVFVASIPVVVFAMRRSKLFVTEVPTT